MVDPFDKANPKYDNALRFVPCQDDTCEVDEAHPWHVTRKMHRELARTAVSVAKPPPKKKPKKKKSQKDRAYPCPRCKSKDRRRYGYCNDCGWIAPWRFRQALDGAGKIGLALDKPKHKIVTEGGKVIAGEWECLTPERGGCGGKGWSTNPGDDCRLCFGRGVLDKNTYESIIYRRGRFR